LWGRHDALIKKERLGTLAKPDEPSRYRINEGTVQAGGKEGEYGGPSKLAVQVLLTYYGRQALCMELWRKPSSIWTPSDELWSIHKI
jgi:hypothetical protein